MEGRQPKRHWRIYQRSWKQTVRNKEEDRRKARGRTFRPGKDEQ